ncbi:MAG: hypothetical protein ABIL58_10810 [Pseudomonadota bacterium]
MAQGGVFRRLRGLSGCGKGGRIKNAIPEPETLYGAAHIPIDRCAQERIGGNGWGLLQVLLEMEPLAAIIDPRAAFADAADRVLTRRALADPRPHVFSQWLPGWRRRLATYLEPAL